MRLDGCVFSMIYHVLDRSRIERIYSVVNRNPCECLPKQGCEMMRSDLLDAFVAQQLSRQKPQLLARGFLIEGKLALGHQNVVAKRATDTVRIATIAQNFTVESRATDKRSPWSPLIQCHRDIVGSTA